MLARLMGRRRMGTGKLGLLIGVALAWTSSAALAQGGVTHALVTPTLAASSIMGMIFFAADIVVIITLVGCSIAGCALAIDAMIHVREARIAPVETTEHLRSLINARQFKELLDFTSTDQSFVSKGLNAGLRRAHLGFGAMREGMESQVGDETATWFRRIEFLNVIGNIGPLIGLMGTVLGMIIAFDALQQASLQGKPPSVQDLSGGIARALFHTFFGLLVAIPSLLVFGFYRTRVDKICSQAMMVTEELLESLRPADGRSAMSGAGDEGRGPAVAKPVPRRVAAPVENA